jgi:hypothetical protein
MLVNTPLVNIAGGKGKGKAIPLQVWTGPEGCRRLGLTNFRATDI